MGGGGRGGSGPEAGRGQAAPPLRSARTRNQRRMTTSSPPERNLVRLMSGASGVLHGGGVQGEHLGLAGSGRGEGALSANQRVARPRRHPWRLRGVQALRTRAPLEGMETGPFLEPFVGASVSAPLEALKDHDAVASAPSLDTSQKKAEVRPGRSERPLGGTHSNGGVSAGSTVT